MATLQCNCNSLALNKPCYPRRRRRLLLQPFSSSTRLVPRTSICTGYNASTSRWGSVVSAVVSEENAVGSSFSAADVFKLTYLEGNSWLWNVGGTNILVDPILVGNLDFGIPWLYDAAKKMLKQFQLSDLPEISCLLITQSLDDHCHLKTLKPFSQKFPNIKVIATPNAKGLLDPLFRNVTYLEPGQSFDIETNYGSMINIKATAGPVLGPPWQRPENGFIVPMKNGDLDSKGLLASLVSGEGTVESFKN
ncbi:Metallo-beta-lactamase [Vigna unguiculata]|uniref:Metallo-beta-lactamase n=1 Tax=Vigna unguiculata TaxID=3917 RepID=A0A4D6LNG1_VIGUN|nr:Metallo-beta-lactamase [Vigna unguiculata]